MYNLAMFVNNINPVAFVAWGLEVRWYGILFAGGLFFNYLLTAWAFKREGHKQEALDSLVMWLFFGLLIGARLGEVFFYEWDYYSRHLIEILYVWRGGLASHGAIIGLFVAYIGWCRRNKVSFFKHIDAISLGMPLTGAFVRYGNFMNSEIVGKPWDGPFSVIFSRLGEDFGRHPVQLYEGDLNVLIFLIVLLTYLRLGTKRVPQGFYLVLMLGLYFAARFGAEFFKEEFKVSAGWPLSMGQVLSLIGIAVVVVLGIISWKRKSRA